MKKEVKFVIFQEKKEAVMLNNQDILEIALSQSAIDLSCNAADFLSVKNKTCHSYPQEKARKYLKLPFFCQLVSYGNNIVASVSPEFEHEAAHYINTYPIEHCFETPNMHVLSDALRPYGYDICFMAEYFLPDTDILSALPCPYPTKMLTPEDFASLYLPEWSNALCKDRKELDRIGIGAYDGETLIGFAGASADCDDMWQIGIDVLPAYRKKGIASALTSHLALEILKLGKVPFYCAAWSNLRSVRNALKSGFRPAWVEMTAKPISMINEMNRID